MTGTTLEHRFVDLVPTNLDTGVVYVSIRYRTAAHLCACGCGHRVITPLRPHRWSLIFDGDTVSLHPSIGNGQTPCRSHYFIRQSQVLWAADLTDDQFEAARKRDLRDLMAETTPAATMPVPRRGRSWWPWRRR